MLNTLTHRYRCAIYGLSHADSLAGLALRLYLVPIFWAAGNQKLAHFGSTVEWFGNNEWGLGLPMPWVLAVLATVAELAGAVLLALGLFTRAICIPLMITMLVAIFSVHIDYGWQAIADPTAPFANARVETSAEKLDMARTILRENGHYDWLTGSGKFVILNNGIEFAVTYLIMLFALLVHGPGRYLSADDWIARHLNRRAGQEA